MVINPLTPSAVRAIGASQLHAEPATVIKELVDNALDACATSISIQVSANMIDVIQVRDNGHGIPPMDRAMVARRHCTSKISSEHDLQNIGGSTLGFRGEALASAAALSGTMTISTRVEGEHIAAVLAIDRQGEVEKTEYKPLPVGTTVRINGLFKPQPVRKQLALRTPEKCIQNIRRMLRSYALARSSVRLSFRVLQSQSSKDDFIYAPKGLGDAIDVAFKMFGAACASQYEWYTMREGGFCLEALLPRPCANLSRASGLGSFISIDARPMSNARGICKQISKSFRGVLQQTGGFADNHKEPFMRLEIQCPADSYDVSVEPTKDDVIFERPDSILKLVRRFFFTFYRAGNSIATPVPQNQQEDELRHPWSVNENQSVFTPISPSPVVKSVTDIRNTGDSDLQSVFKSTMYSNDGDDVGNVSTQAESNVDEDSEELQEAEMDIRLSDPWTLARLNAVQKDRSQANAQADTLRNISYDQATACLPIGNQAQAKRMSNTDVLPTPRSSSPSPSHNIDQHNFVESDIAHSSSVPHHLSLFALPSPQSTDISSRQLGNRVVDCDDMHAVKGNQVQAVSDRRLSTGTALVDIPYVGRRPLRAVGNGISQLKRDKDTASLKTRSLPSEKVWFDHLEGYQALQRGNLAEKRKCGKQGAELMTRRELSPDNQQPSLSRPRYNHDIRDYVNTAKTLDFHGAVQKSCQTQNLPSGNQDMNLCSGPEVTHERPDGCTPSIGSATAFQREVAAMRAHFKPNEHQPVPQLNPRKPAEAAASYHDVSMSEYPSQREGNGLISPGNASTGLHSTALTPNSLNRIPIGQGTYGIVLRYADAMPEIIKGVGSGGNENSALHFSANTNAPSNGQDLAFAGIGPDLGSISLTLHCLLLNVKLDCVHSTDVCEPKVLRQILENVFTAHIEDAQGDDDEMLTV